MRASPGIASPERRTRLQKIVPHHFGRHSYTLVGNLEEPILILIFDEAYDYVSALFCQLRRGSVGTLLERVANLATCV